MLLGKLSTLTCLWQVQAFHEASDAVSWAVETQQVRWSTLLVCT